jgi:hypothetical protein
MAKIGYAYVGELSSFKNSSVEDTPDGMRFCRPILVRELQKRKHKIYSLQFYQENKFFPNVDYSFSPGGVKEEFPNIDILFVEWRWKTYKGNTPDLIRQNNLLSRYHKNIPVILYDASYKINHEDEEKWSNAIIADPGVRPKYLTRNRERLLFWSDFKKIEELTKNNSIEGHSQYGYVGNDYERRDSFAKYYVDPSKRLRDACIQTSLYGNWLKKSAERNPAIFFKFSEYESIYFGGRWSFKDSMKFQSKFLATTHIAKQEYYDQGNITVRFFDSLATGTPGLVPEEYTCNHALGKDWIVSNAHDVVEKVKNIANMSYNERIALVDEQANKLLKYFPETNVISTADFIESKI